jgi:protein phosphatase
VTDRAGGLPGAADDQPRIELGQATDVGRVRSVNEDSILCEPLESRRAAEQGLFCAVADGMGGHAAGEEASSLAVKVAHAAFYEGPSMGSPLETLRQAVAEANAAVYDAGAGKTGRDHMGTTLTAAVLLNRRVLVGHVGDSRCYLVRDNLISQISRDHSWVAEEVAAGRMTPAQARVNPRRNIITRALGLRPDVDVDVYEAPIEPGDAVVICSDGLHGLVGEDDIVAYVQRLPAANAVDGLVRLANERGGPDNISVVIARVIGMGEDEADTQRGFPVLNEGLMPTARADLSDLGGPTELSPPPAAPPIDPEQHLDAADAVTAPTPVLPPRPAPQPAPAPAPPVTQMFQLPPNLPMGPAAEPAPAPAQTQGPAASFGPAAAPDFDHADDPEPRMPRSPVSDRALAQPGQPSQGGRSGGMALIVVLVLLVVLGSAVGYLLFRLFISS